MTGPEVARILDAVQFKDWIFYVGHFVGRNPEDDRVFIQVRYLEADADHDDATALEIQHGRKWLISKHATVSEVVQTAFKAVVTSMEHQAREHFTYRGARVFGPHFDVDQLVALCRTPESLDARPAP